MKKRQENILKKLKNSNHSNVRIPDEDLKELLGSKVRPGPHNHYISDCPLCGKPKHFYVNRGSQLWDCKKCGEEGNIVSLLVALNKLYLLGEFKTIDRTKITLLSDWASQFDEEELDVDVPNRKKPIGFKRVYKDDYLKGRKLTKANFKKFEIVLS